MTKLVFDNGEGIVYRPPREADSFILRVTTGCSHNKCLFCGMYRSVKFRIRDEDNIAKQIKQAARQCPNIKKVFLADGNALVLPTDKLIKIIKMLKEELPNVTQISCYAGAKDILRKSDEELTELRNMGLKMIYLGIESGDDQVLAFVNKGATAGEMIAAGQRVMAAGIKLTAMIVVGLGGKTQTTQHAVNTARVINEINPNILGPLTLTVEDNTPLAELVKCGEFALLTPLEVMQEFKTLIQHINVTRPCVFDSNHIFNMLPTRCVLPKDKKLLLSEIEQVIEFLQENE